MAVILSTLLTDEVRATSPGVSLRRTAESTENNSPMRDVPKSMFDGPNCFTAALFQTDYLNYLRIVTHSEFKFVINNFFKCKEVKKINLIKHGNLGTVYLNDMPIHAFTMLDPQTAFEKDSFLAINNPKITKNFWERNVYCKSPGLCKLGSYEISTHVDNCNYVPPEELIRIKDDFNEVFLAISEINTKGEIHLRQDQFGTILERLYLSIELSMHNYTSKEIYYTFVLLKSLNHQLYAYLKSFSSLEPMNLKTTSLNKVIEVAFKLYSLLFKKFNFLLQREDVLKLIDGGSPRYIKNLKEFTTAEFIKYPLELINFFEFLPSEDSIKRLLIVYNEIDDFNIKESILESISRIKTKCMLQTYFCGR
ncbi:MAG: hypothetical protein H6625_09160 [Bdellovibrionaceae bacterium]|nr:hypothetical protein [Pseudobdellovibrionaceae bacterium]